MRKPKPHNEPMIVGRIAKLFPDGDYGILETLAGEKVRFHRNSEFEGRFEHLRIGSGVHFIEEPGEQGPEASTVKLVRQEGESTADPIAHPGRTGPQKNEGSRPPRRPPSRKRSAPG